MSKDTQAPSGVLAGQLPAIRARRQLSAEALAKRVKALGGGLDRAAISKIETGARGVSLDEALLLAVALDVAPLHLFVPRDDAQPVALTPSLTASAPQVRQWVRGQQPLPGRDDRAYRTEVPDSEWDHVSQRLKNAERAVTEAEQQRDVAEAYLQRVSGERARLDSPFNLAQMGGNSATVERMDARLDVAYDRVAEAQVTLQTALAEAKRVKDEYQADVIAYVQSLQPKGDDDGQR